MYKFALFEISLCAGYLFAVAAVIALNRLATARGPAARQEKPTLYRRPRLEAVTAQFGRRLFRSTTKN
jgi:hypothetical protein